MNRIVREYHAAASHRSRSPALRLPDAVHVATASRAGCPVFLTNDLRLPLPPDIKRVRLTHDALDDLRAGT